MIPYQVVVALLAERRATLLSTGDPLPCPIPHREPLRPVEGHIPQLRRLRVAHRSSMPPRPAPVAVPAEPTPRERELAEDIPSVRCPNLRPLADRRLLGRHRIDRPRSSS